jgi:hypothetical protein
MDLNGFSVHLGDIRILRVVLDTVSLPQYWTVLSPLLGENEINHFFRFFAHFHRFTLLASVRFQNVLCFEAHLNCSWFHNFKPSFPKIGVDGHSTLRRSADDSCGTFPLEWKGYITGQHSGVKRMSSITEVPGLNPDWRLVVVNCLRGVLKKILFSQLVKKFPLTLFM